jgi:hypothetical protein
MASSIYVVLNMQGMVCNGIYVISDLALPIQKLILKTIWHQNYVVNCVDNDTRGRLYIKGV